MMQSSRFALVCAAGVQVLPAAALADSFNNLGDFLAAVPDAQLVNFDVLPDGSATTVGEIGSLFADYGLEFPPGNQITDTFLEPKSPPRAWVNDTLVGNDRVFDFDINVSGVRAVGAHNVRFGGFPNGAILRAFDAAGNELESATSDSEFATLDFFGVTTDADIERVTITFVLPMGWGLDDLYVGVGSPCRADLDGDGELTIFDFLAFQNLFDAGDPIADFDGDGSLTIFDFLAFQNEFDAGCE